MPHSTSTQTITILEEVKANQELLRSRLAGALSSPPPNISESSLPTVPLIDLSPSFSNSLSDRQKVASQIREACVTSGFFQISNHGITKPAIDGVLEQAKSFFHGLTASQKDELHIRHSALFRGYEAGGDTYVNPDDSSEAETESKEGFNWGYEPSLDPTSSSSGSYVELDGTPPEETPNSSQMTTTQWPPTTPVRRNIWPSPTLLPNFKESITTYYSQILNLSRHLFRLFALSLHLPETYFDTLTTHPGGIARLLYYPPQSPEQLSAKESKSKLGLGAHTDYECFTLLLSTAHPGLEILFPPSPETDGKPIWRPCPIRPDTLTVNVADFLMRWTNGLYKSTVHRVVSRGETDGEGETKGSEARYSVPFFFSINYDAEVDWLPEEAVGVSRFERVKAGEYVLERLRATTG